MSIDLPGFADPVLGAQACFRAVLAAMSRPGVIQMAGEGITPPDPLAPATAAVLLTLVDAETPLAVAPGLAAAGARIDFHCGAPRGGKPAFVVTDALPDLAALDAGTDEGPEDSVTVILQVAALGAGARFELAGPGLAVPAALAVEGLPADFAARWAANHGLYPRGIDLILCAGTRIAALPRSVAVSEG